MARKTISLVLALYLILLGCGVPVAASNGNNSEPGAYWKTEKDYEELEEKPYESYTYYSELAGILKTIDKESERVKVEIIGKSAAGHDLFLVTISDPSSMGRLGKYASFRKVMLEDPEKALERLEKGEDFKVPVFINASIHGNETTGTDAALRMIETLAYGDDEEIRKILDNTIVLININQNPDGRITDQRYNSNGFDINRDFITQSQPETRATVEAIVKWNPMIFLDLHGFVNPMLIEPCTPPHNPNYEYDLYIKWALQQAETMEAAVEANTPLQAQIPYRDWGESWDDYPPIFTPMYSMYHGAVGHTLETPVKDEDGVDAHYYAIMAAAKFAAEHKVEMFHDQIEIFRRGVERLIFEDDIEFPYAYIIPADDDNQMDVAQAYKMVEHMMFNGIEVHRASRPFTASGTEYPAGTFVVMMNQAKRGLVNTMLWDGQDISYDPGLDMYDISAWNLPELWGFTALPVEDAFEASLTPVTNLTLPAGEVDKGAGSYLLLNDKVNSPKAVNRLLAEGYRVSMVMKEVEGVSAGTFVIPGDQKGIDKTLTALSKELGLNFIDAGYMPQAVKELVQPKVAVIGSGDITFALNEMGFDVTTLGRNDSLDGFDAVVVSERRTNTGNVVDFVQNGGGYVGIGYGGAYCNDRAGLLDVDYESASYYSNGIVKVDYDAESALTGSFDHNPYAFVFRPVWFENVATNVDVDASLEEDDFFMAGFWPGREEAAGKAVVVKGSVGEGKVVLLGIDPSFRAHPQYTFRLLANSIYYACK